MFMKVTFLILLSRFPNKITCSRACIPNSHILLNGKICACDNVGTWKDADCYAVGRRQVCRPGQVVFQGCNRCICREDGQLSCTEEGCSRPSPSTAAVLENLAAVLPWCNPFRTYYITCNICVCPASGRTSEARCALDISCTFYKAPSTTDISTRRDTCIPKVMYLFPCLHCLCNDDGYFIIDKCVETCVKKQAESTRRCIPKTLYRKGCNVCLCPDNSIPDDQLCTNSSCEYPTTFKFLRTLKSKPIKCKPHEFMKPRCVYCDCNHDGVIDEKTCLELECLKSDDLKYDLARDTCSPGEMVPFCMECLCTRSGITSDDFCSRACSYQSKIKVLERIMAMPKNDYIIDKDSIKRNSGSEVCKPDSIYIEQGRYCLCPDTGNTNFNLCTGSDKSLATKTNKTSDMKHVAIDFNVSCEPSTFVEFDCNTCFCSKKGKIDPKWCTYDDCEAKRIIQESHAIHPIISTTESQLSDTCNPGSISNVDCNFCICPDSGFMEERVCTKNDCSAFAKPPTNDKFACEPLAYYEVDCNICYCPRDGVKNVAKCTKNHCEKSFLRSDVCVPGQLFSDECNVCVCPPNGNKAEKACTNYTCTDTAPWKKIFQLSESLLGNQITEDATRNLDLCFPGEEFVIGCKLCVCPDMGLRIYATCSPTFCEEESNGDRNAQAEIGEDGNNRESKSEVPAVSRAAEKGEDIVLYRKLNTRREECMTLNFTSTFSRHKCTPGSMYIIRCRECICPYMGDINYFCRPLPHNFYCEQAIPGFNYMPMGRRTDEDKENGTKSADDDSNALNVTVGNQTYVGNSTANSRFIIKPVRVEHDHTRYECDKPGKIMDECFMCECDGKTLIAEHCFQNDSQHCAQATPSFLRDYNNINSNSNNQTDKT